MIDIPPVVPKRPKVSIMLITYNHEKYIAETLDSILMQETEYDYEINVIEDCSTDKTREVVMRYVEKYPDKVKPYFNKKNLGFKVTQKNFYQGFKTLKGEYIAIIEGDDYWSSPHKLQKQIAFLEANPGYVACAHNVIKKYEDGSKEPHRFLYWPGKPDTHTIEDLIYLNAYFHITTLMFRNVFNGIPPAGFENPWSCEIFVTIAHAQFGPIRYFDEDMSVYRAHGGGRFSTMTTMEGWFFNIGGLRRYNQWLGYRYAKAFAGSIVRYCTVVLRDSGKEEGTVPLTFKQTLKYAGIRTYYKFLFLLLEAKDNFITSFNSRANTRSTLRKILLTPLYVVIFVFRSAIAIFEAILSTVFRYYFSFISKLIPQRWKLAIYTTLKNIFTHSDARHLYWLIREGKLFSRKAAYHFKNFVLFYIRTARSRLYRACKSLFISTADKKP